MNPLLWSLFVLAAPIPDSYSPLPAQGCPSRAEFHLGHYNDAEAWFGRGGAPTAAGIACLAELGYTDVVDLRSEPENNGSEERNTLKAGMTYHPFPMATDSVVPSKACRQAGWPSGRCNESAVAQALDFLKGVRGAKNHKAFIHCSRGEDRTGLLVGALRVTLEGKPKTQARREMLDFGYSPYAPLEQVWNKLTLTTPH